VDQLYDIIIIHEFKEYIILNFKIEIYFLKIDGNDSIYFHTKYWNYDYNILAIYIIFNVNFIMTVELKLLLKII